MWLNWFHRGRLAGEAIVTDMLFVSGDRFREVQLAAELIELAVKLCKFVVICQICQSVLYLIQKIGHIWTH